MSFKSPINDGQQLMAITAEECGELVQVCMKLVRKNATLEEMMQDQKFREKLVEEVGDVACMIGLLAEHGLISYEELEARANVKLKKLKQWSTIADVD